MKTKLEKYKDIIKLHCTPRVPFPSLPKKLGWCYMSTECYIDLIHMHECLPFNDNVSILAMEYHDDIIELLVYGNDFRELQDDEEIPKYIFIIDKYITEVHSKKGSEVVGTDYTCIWKESKIKVPFSEEGFAVRHSSEKVNKLFKEF